MSSFRFITRCLAASALCLAVAHPAVAGEPANPPSGCSADSLFPGQQFAAGDGPYFVTAADLDGDGDTDLAVANDNSDDVSVLWSQCNHQPAPTCPADFNGDGQASAGDILEFLALWSGMTDPRGDFTDDGIYAVGDILEFLGVWSLGCP